MTFTTKMAVVSVMYLVDLFLEHFPCKELFYGCMKENFSSHFLDKENTFAKPTQLVEEENY